MSAVAWGARALSALRRLRLLHRVRHVTLCRVAHAVSCRGCEACYYIKTPWPEVRADGSWQ